MTFWQNLRDCGKQAQTESGPKRDSARQCRLITFLAAGPIVILLGALIAVGQPGKQPPAAPAKQAPAASGAAPPTAPTPAHTPPRFLVVLDAAHGGSDSGARLGNQLLEKNFVLTLSVRLRSMLAARGIAVLTDRESDINLPAVNRAEIANHVGASACISLHATASGNGVHLFTSSLTEAPLTRFLLWDTAQGAYVDQSLRLSSEINSAMTSAEIPVILGRTALQPLDNFTCPAVAVEMAPLDRSGHIVPLSDQDYQNRVLATLTAALVQWQRDRSQHP